MDDIAAKDGGAGPGVDVLRRVFFHPDSFRPDATRETITRATADTFLSVAEALRQHQRLTEEAYTPEQRAHFLIRLPDLTGGRHLSGLDDDGAARVAEIAHWARALVRWRDEWLNPPPPARGTLDVACDRLIKARTLNAAVLRAYGWPETLSDEAILERLLGLNGERGAGGGWRVAGSGWRVRSSHPQMRTGGMCPRRSASCALREMAQLAAIAAV